MKSTAYAFSFIVTLLLACNPHAPTSSFTGECVPVSMVRSVCGTAVFKIQDPAFYHYGENVEGEENVFLGILECSSTNESTNAYNSPYQLIYVELNPKNFEQGCSICQAIVNYSGRTNYNVRINEKCSSLQAPE